MATYKRGRDIAAPMSTIEFQGKHIPIKFSNRAARIAEDIYAEEFGCDIGYYAILAEVAVPKHRALMAVLYGAVAAAGNPISWQEFDENFHLTDVPGVAAAIRRGTMDSLPQEDPDDAGNPEATPTEG